MALLIGRQGYLGVAIEATPGTSEASPTTFYPFTENSLMDKHEPLQEISSRASRIKDHDMVSGKKWGEGDVAGYLDGTQSGYLFKLAFGNEVKTEVNTTPPVHDHQFYVTASGNTPKTATLWNYRGASNDVRQHSYAAVDSLEFEVTNEDIATVTASLITAFPSEVTAPALTTVSGTVFTWKDMTVKFGTTVQGALDSSAIKLTNFKFTLNNNVETQYRAGSNTPDVITAGEAEALFEYTLFLEDDTEIDRFRNLDKSAMVVDLVGAGIASGYTERLRLTVNNFALEDQELETDLDGMFAITGNARCIRGEADPGFIDVILRNGKATTY